MTKYDNASGMISSATATYAATVGDINNVINMIILIVSLVNIVLVVIFKVYDRLKDGKLTEEEKNDTIEDVKDAVRESSELINKNRKEGK